MKKHIRHKWPKTKDSTGREACTICGLYRYYVKSEEDGSRIVKYTDGVNHYLLSPSCLQPITNQTKLFAND